ncbi:MAG TPA: hypothetical protein P5080_05350 [Candidatus Paceibacterota bacterium]|nr:hypothetical protein [Candidatus Pacearchaeota archaeon]HRZ51373.1 hypothetical protein [Candidatus Paceibacterota bacterium]HSA37095.1 hypothetical protein [Candidatus Paceibacterota bacterium]
MTIINRQEQFNPLNLAALIEKQQSGPCVSIYIPTARDAVKENRIRFENQLKKIKRYVADLDTEAKSILARPSLLLEDPFFWQNQSDGLAFFATSDFNACYCLPILMPEIAVFGNRFHLKPLFQFIGENGIFHLLSLSRKNTRFYRGNRYGMTEIKVPGLPGALTDVLPDRDFEKMLQSHGSKPQNGGEFFHGKGGQKDVRKINLQKYFRKIDFAVCNTMASGKKPLIIAGPGYFLSLYREINTYRNLIQEGVEGNFDKTGIENTLYGSTWRIADHYFSQSKITAINRYRAMKQSNLVSNDVKQIVPAAINGLIETLIVAVGVHVWGTCDLDSKTITTHENEQSGDIDLLDIAAVHTFLHRGSLFAVKKNEMPDNAKIAAILRY